MAVDREFPRNPGLGLACPSERLCVAGGTRGLFVSTDPAGGTSTWKLIIAPPAPALKTVVFQGSCPTVSFCAFPAYGGQVLTSENPSGGPGAWKVARTGAPTSRFGATHYHSISCASRSLCVEVEPGTRTVVASANPTGGRAAWQVRKLRETADSVSCVRPSLCVITTQAGNILTSTHPTKGRSPWRFTSLSGGGPPPFGVGLRGVIRPVACASTRYCLLASDIGGGPNILRSTHPTGGQRTWFPPGPFFHGKAFSGASCTPGRFCAFTSNDGTVFTNSRAPISRRNWTVTRTDRTRDLGVNISCVSSRFCVINRSDGKLFIGRG